MGRNQNDEVAIFRGGDTSDRTIEIPVIGDTTSANGTNNVTISNVAPAGVGTATISDWLNVKINGTLYYIPMWT